MPPLLCATAAPPRKVVIWQVRLSGKWVVFWDRAGVRHGRRFELDFVTTTSAAHPKRLLNCGAAGPSAALEKSPRANHGDLVGQGTDRINATV